MQKLENALSQYSYMTCAQQLVVVLLSNQRDYSLYFNSEGPGFFQVTKPTDTPGDFSIINPGISAQEAPLVLMGRLTTTLGEWCPKAVLLLQDLQS